MRIPVAFYLNPDGTPSDDAVFMYYIDDEPQDPRHLAEIREIEQDQNVRLVWIDVDGIILDRAEVEFVRRVANLLNVANQAGIAGFEGADSNCSLLSTLIPRLVMRAFNQLEQEKKNGAQRGG